MTAWILWVWVIGTAPNAPPAEWFPVNGYPTHPACAVMEDRSDTQAKAKKDTERILSYACFPLGFDPRVVDTKGEKVPR